MADYPSAKFLSELVETKNKLWEEKVKQGFEEQEERLYQGLIEEAKKTLRMFLQTVEKLSTANKEELFYYPIDLAEDQVVTEKRAHRFCCRFLNEKPLEGYNLRPEDYGRGLGYHWSIKW